MGVVSSGESKNRIAVFLAFNPELLGFGLGLAFGVVSEARAFAVDHAAIDHPSHASGGVDSPLNDRPTGFFASHKGQIHDTFLTLIKQNRRPLLYQSQFASFQ